MTCMRAVALPTPLRCKAIKASTRVPLSSPLPFLPSPHLACHSLSQLPCGDRQQHVVLTNAASRDKREVKEYLGPTVPSLKDPPAACSCVTQQLLARLDVPVRSLPTSHLASLHISRHCYDP